MNNSVGQAEKVSVTIISWKKAFTMIATIALFSNIMAVGLISYFMSISQYAQQNRLLTIVMVVWVMSEVVGLLFLAHSLKKKRVDVDAFGLLVHINKDIYSLDWKDVSGIEITKQKMTQERKAGEYYKISLVDNEDFPYSEIFVEKTKQLEEEMGLYYKGKFDIT